MDKNAKNIINSSQINIKAIHDRALKEYDDSLVYMMNYLQQLGQTTTDMMNNNIQVLKEKLAEIMANRNSLLESIQRNNDLQNQQQQMYNH